MAQEAPKSSPKPEKIDVKKQYVFSIDFRRVRPPFSKDFLVVFRRKLGTDFELRVGAANPKIMIFRRKNAYFQQKARILCELFEKDARFPRVDFVDVPRSQNRYHSAPHLCRIWSPS